MCAVTASAVLTLSIEDQVAARARAVLRQTGCITHADTLLDEAQLLVSELVTNAVRYGTPPIALKIACDESTG